MLAILLMQLPVLYFLARVPLASQLMKACVTVSGLTFIIGFKA